MQFTNENKQFDWTYHGYLIFKIRSCCISERICEELIFKGEKSYFFKLSES